MQTAAPALFAFMGAAFSSVGLSAWRSAYASPRYENRSFHIGQRKQIIRTHLLLETSSDYIGLGYVDKKDTIIKKDWWQNIVAAKVLIISMEYRRFKTYGSSRLNITS